MVSRLICRNGKLYYLLKINILQFSLLYPNPAKLNILAHSSLTNGGFENILLSIYAQLFVFQICTFLYRVS